MIRLLVILVLIVFFQNSSAQDQVTPLPAPPSEAVHTFFQSLHINIDSAQTPQLYYKIHEWLNTKYKYAGFDKHGIDCSGFTCIIYKEVYCKDIIRGSAELFKTVEPVKEKNLQEGDLVFFKIKRNRISHVGIYIGNNKFAHASVNYGVTVSDLDEEYYRKRFYRGGRVKM